MDKILGIFADGKEVLSDRLSERYKRIVEMNIDAFKNKRVIDIAANNGRWSYAAIHAGAISVDSIEWRQDRINDARSYFKKLGCDDKINTNQGDMFSWLDRFDSKVDTVLCLGIFYHIMDHYMLLRKIAATSPEVIIMDSGFVRSFRNSIHIQLEDPSKHLNTSSVYEGQQSELVGFVSLGLMLQMSWNLGYRCHPMLWDPKVISNPECVQDYMMGRRFTLRLDKMNRRSDNDWQQNWKDVLITLNKNFADLFNKATHDSVVDARAKSSLSSSEFSVF